MSPRCGLALRSLLLLPLVTALAACAVSRVNPDGSIDTWGLAHVRVPAPAGRVGGVRLEVEGVGLIVSSSPAGSGVALGYASQSVTVLGSDALVCLPLPAAAPLAALNAKPVANQGDRP